ncbi:MULTISPECIES: DUF5819 family protein [Streptomyces]|uniref:DUF5819 family protein n=1 Tax=Streptomyces heilongjiangensis TaxID=945052 RepID=A0ABW1BF07_9ACTN|nr:MULTISPECIES: DUF5819 family protein [Streptomyces]MDC2946112.1 DUF5819 family protein [Streptomyces heilongjiangensis]
MDAYDEVSNARRGPDEPEGPVSPGPGDTAADENDSADADTDTPAPASPPVAETDTSIPAPASSSSADDPAGVPVAGADTGRAPVPARSPAWASRQGPYTPPPPHSPSPPNASPPPHARPLSDGTLAPAQSPPPAASGIASLPLPYQIVVALALAVVAVVACVHVGMVFLHVAPSNTMTKQHGQAVDDWVYPEFEQNWKLFAPNPLQQNIAVQVRAEVRKPGGGFRETGWYDLSALDGAAIDGNLMPSHTEQNELRRAWDFYVSTHDTENRATSSRGELSERYLRRIVVMRLDRELDGERADGSGGVVERIQVRSRTTNVPAPEWSEEQVSDKPVVRELSWWSVTDRDRTEASAE